MRKSGRGTRMYLGREEVAHRIFGCVRITSLDKVQYNKMQDELVSKARQGPTKRPDEAPQSKHGNYALGKRSDSKIMAPHLAAIT